MFLGSKMRNEHFCDFEQKYTPETITFIRFWATFPQAWFFIIISFCRKKTFLAKSYFPDVFFQFSGKSMFDEKSSKKGIPFPGARARSEPFSSSRAHGKYNFPDFAPKSGNNSILAPKSRNNKFSSLLEQKWHFRPHGANPYKRNGFLGLLGPIFLIFRFLVKILQL